MNVVKLVTLHFYESATTITATNKQALFYKNKQKKKYQFCCSLSFCTLRSQNEVSFKIVENQNNNKTRKNKNKDLKFGNLN